MLIPIATGKVITKEAKEKILHRQFSEEQLVQIYNEIVNDKDNSRISFISDAIVMFLVFGFMFFQATERLKNIDLVFIFMFSIFYLITLIIFYYGCFKMQKNRFKKFVRKSYPELTNLFK